MLTRIMAALQGKKTYSVVLLWIAYKIASNNGYFPVSPDLEVALLGIAGLSAREAISTKK